MAFPTTSILTSFTGGSETPISEGGTWVSTSGGLVGGADANRDGAGHMTHDSSNFEMRRAETVGPQIEIWATISTTQAVFKQLWFLSGSDSYRLELTSGDVWRFYKTGDVQIGADLATQAISNGDAIGFEYVGGTLRAYHKPSAGSWGQIGTDRADALLASGTGNLAIAAGGQVDFDDFGGGTVSSAGAISGSGFQMFAQWG